MFKTAYFVAMGLALFSGPQIVLYTTNRKFVFDRTFVYLLLAFILPTLFMFLPESIAHLRYINFVQHSVGGGLAVGLVAIFLIENLKSNFKMMENFFVQLLFVYFLVCGLGVANEIFEFTLDLLKVGIFSADRYDTWYDLVANTTGALGIFVIYKLGELIRKLTF